MKLKDIISIIEDWAPIENAEDFDNVGLIVGDADQNVKKAIITIDSLLVGIYSFRMFKDLNKNSLWDSGNIKNLTPPEKLKFFNETIDIKKDWEIDVFIE